MSGSAKARAAHIAIRLAVMNALGASACSSPAPAQTSCPSDLPAACPSNAPSYATQVSGIIATRCSPCHDPGGTAGPNWVFTSYGAVSAARAEILNQVYACVMPPAGSTQPSADERAALLAWLVCHAPNN